MDNQNTSDFKDFYDDIISHFLKYCRDVEEYDGFIFYGVKDPRYLEYLREGFQKELKKRV